MMIKEAGVSEGLGPLTVLGPIRDGYEAILDVETCELVATLTRRFRERVHELLAQRRHQQSQFDKGARPGFREETRWIREREWTVAPLPDDLRDRRVEITGPVDRKMIINALNSGARAFMADFEDATAPAWDNVMQGQINLRDAVARTITWTSPAGRRYALEGEPAVLMVRPRGWHLFERHAVVDGRSVPAAIFDFAVFMSHNAAALMAAGTGPYFYLPKLESHLEARLWNDVFLMAQDELGIPRGTIRATVLIETILAAFEMEEILYELRDHSAGLNAGRWDYIFSIIKKFRNHPAMVLPDRAQVTMTVPFMRAYTDLLIETCHRRGAHAMGGMSAFIPSRRDEVVNRVAMAKVREDKERESQDGHDGTWVAHPDLVPLATDVFDEVLGNRPNQIDKRRDDVTPDAAGLIDTKVEGGTVTLDGVRTNVDVAIQYIASWLRGNGAAAIYNLMEDAATAEISRSQIWQWIRHGARLDDGRVIDRELVMSLLKSELEGMRSLVGEERFEAGRFDEARDVFVGVALGDEFVDFLTLPASELIE